MNITLRIPDELGKQAKHLAVDEGKSLSRIVTELLESRIRQSESSGYAASRQKAWAVMEEGFSGGGGRFDRQELHSRD